MVDPMIGMVLPRRYRIIKLLGRGSMSVVYEGCYEPLDQLVAVKMLKSHLVSDPHQAKRFQQEIKTAGSLSHPNIVGILDFGLTEQGVPYLIMEHLEGKSIAEILESDERISVNRAIKIFSQAADALAYAHREGVIHRDIKPSNMIVINTEEENDVVKIVDFGIAKIQNAGGGATDKKQSSANTGSGELIGTPLYMSPEQSQGKELDGRSDIYSLGCVMYHALTGKPPFVGETAMDTIRMQVTATAAPIEVVRPDLYFPESMQTIINKALAKDPRMRYQRMEHFKADLDACIQQRQNSMVNSVSVARIQSAAPPVVQPKSAGFQMPAMTLPVISVIVGVVIVAGTIIWGVTTDVGKKDLQIKIGLPLPNEGAWHATYAKGEAALTEGRYEDAEKDFKEALEDSKKFPQPDARTAKSLNALAQVYYAEDRLNDALSASKEAVGIANQNQIASKDPVTLADALANESRILCANSQFGEAEAAGNQALDIREKNLGKNHQDVAMSLEGLAEIQCKRGNFDRAQEMLTDAERIATKALGEDNPEVASIQHNLGLVLERQHKYPQANSLFNKALGVRQQYLGTQHPLVSDTLCALGTLNFNMRKDAEAESMFNNALDIRMKIFGEKSSKTAEVYSCLAILYDNDHKWSQAEECYRKAVEIRESIWGNKSPKLVRSLQNLAKFLREHGQKNGAEVYEAQIKRIQSSKNG